MLNLLKWWGKSLLKERNNFVQHTLYEVIRHMSLLVSEDIDSVRPEKSLTVPLKSAYGRDNFGHRTGRNRQKGHKRLYRIIDFKRNKMDVPAKVASRNNFVQHTLYEVIRH